MWLSARTLGSICRTAKKKKQSHLRVSCNSAGVLDIVCEREESVSPGGGVVFPRALTELSCSTGGEELCTHPFLGGTAQRQFKSLMFVQLDL